MSELPNTPTPEALMQLFMQKLDHFDRATEDDVTFRSGGHDTIKLSEGALLDAATASLRTNVTNGTLSLEDAEQHLDTLGKAGYLLKEMGSGDRLTEISEREASIHDVIQGVTANKSPQALNQGIQSISDDYNESIQGDPNDLISGPSLRNLGNSEYQDEKVQKEQPKKSGDKKKKKEYDGSGWIPNEASWEGWDKILNSTDKDEKKVKKNHQQNDGNNAENNVDKEADTPTKTTSKGTDTMPDGMQMSAMTDTTSAMDDVVSEIELGDYAAEASAEATEAAAQVIEAGVETVAEVGMALGGG